MIFSIKAVGKELLFGTLVAREKPPAKPFVRFLAEAKRHDYLGTENDLFGVPVRCTWHRNCQYDFASPLPPERCIDVNPDERESETALSSAFGVRFPGRDRSEDNLRVSQMTI